MPTQKIQDFLYLAGKTAIVTGGALGIGRAIADRLAEAGANVVIADINEKEAKVAAKELTTNGYNVKTIVTDVSKEEEVKKMVSKAISTFGSIDILVNNAGIYPTYPLLDVTAENFERVIKTNLMGVVFCTQNVAKQMVKQGKGGKIINISSIDALHPSAVGLAHYDASKHGIWGFTKSAALELAPHKIWVNAVAPGVTMTPGMELAPKANAKQKEYQEKAIEAIIQKIPMHRMADPDDQAKVVLFLASDMSSYLTGIQIPVDGGMLLT